MILSQGDMQYARDHGVVKLGEDVRNVLKANLKNSSTIPIKWSIIRHVQ